MAKYKLTYFNAKARAETSRILFALAGVEYEDFRFAREDWESLKPTTPLGQVPVLTVNGKAIPQSRAIERHLAREFGYYGKNNMENTMCDVVLETINDVRPEVRKYFFETDESKKAELSKTLSENVFPKFTKFIENMLKDNGGQFLVGNELTLADLAVFDIIQQIIIWWGEAILDYSATIKAHCEMIRSIPRIKEWLDKRPKTAR